MPKIYKYGKYELTRVKSKTNNCKGCFFARARQHACLEETSKGFKYPCVGDGKNDYIFIKKPK